MQAGSGAVSNAALPLAGIGDKGQVAGPIAGAIVAVGDLADNRQHVGDNGDNNVSQNHNHIKEVKHSNNEHP